jgi:putative transposase
MDPTRVSKCVVEGAFDDLAKAYANFFAGRAAYPNYKKKGKSHESFDLSNDAFMVGSRWIGIPGLGRFVFLSSSLDMIPFSSAIYQATHALNLLAIESLSRIPIRP